MDTLHRVLRTMRPDTTPETKAQADAAPDHVTVFREFLAHLERIQRKAPVKTPKRKAPPRRKPPQR